MLRQLHPRRVLTAAVIVLATAASGACSGEISVSATGEPTTATATTSPAATANTATPSASPTTWSGPDRRDPRAGTDKAVLTAEPVVTTARSLPFTEAEQRAAAAWANTFIHASHLDMDALPTKADANLWRAEMTTVRHAGYANAVKTKTPTFGQTFSTAEKNHMRATEVERYAMKFEMPYNGRVPDFDSGAVLLRATWLSHYDMYASPTMPNDRKVRLGRSLMLRIVHGPDAARPYQLAAWDYLDHDTAWQYQQPDGSWVAWK